MPLRLKHNLMTGIYHTGAHHFIGKVFGGVGAILMLHRIVDKKSDSPAQYLTVTSDYLEQSILELSSAGYEFASMSKLQAALTGAYTPVQRLVVLTFDDGYRDNLTLALPILEKYGIPAMLYVASGAPDRAMDAWFLRLERLVKNSEWIDCERLGFPGGLKCATTPEKNHAYAKLTDVAHADIGRFKELILTLSPKSEISDPELCAEAFLGWDELRMMADHPLITIGGHTVSHACLAALTEEEAFAEIAGGRDRLSSQLGRAVEHFAYPYGGRTECGAREFALVQRAGFKTAVTTRYGLIRPGHAHHPFALPRMTLGGPEEMMKDTLLDVSGARVAVSKKFYCPLVTV